MAPFNHHLKISSTVGILFYLASSLLFSGCVFETSLPPTTTEPTTSEPVASEPTNPAPLEPEPAAPEPITSEPTVPEPPTDSDESLAEQESAVTERLTGMGVSVPEDVKAFLEEMRTAASTDDREAIAQLVLYPFTTYDTGTPLKTYQSSAELLADYDQVVTPYVIEKMIEARYADIFTNYQGSMIGNGAVWFIAVDGELKIKSINGGG